MKLLREFGAVLVAGKTGTDTSERVPGRDVSVPAFRARSFLVASFALLAVSSVATAQVQYRPSKEFRSINTDVYEVGIQKSGRVNVRLISGEPVFTNACPMVWLDGDSNPKPLTVDGRATTRQPVHDALGVGTGMLFAKRDCIWVVRTYLTKPYLSAEVTFVNASRKPVKVRMLSPWSVGDAKAGTLSLGPGTANSVALGNGQSFDNPINLRTPAAADSDALDNLTVYNPGTRRSLTAGFVTHVRAYGQIQVASGDAASPDAFGQFFAQCVYDPPVEVPPGGRLTSEWVYLSVCDSNPLDGLEGYGMAAAAALGVKTKDSPVAHGWDNWSNPDGPAPTEASLLAALDAVEARLARYGWTHFTVGRGWERSIGDGEPDPERFPHGMKWFADQIHERGMTAGLWMSPFLAHRDAGIVREHPDWFIEPMVRDQAKVPEGSLVLDVTAPRSLDFVRALCAKITQEWGYDVLVNPELACPLLGPESFADRSLTQVEVVAKGLQAVREALGNTAALLEGGPPPLAAPYVDVMGLGGVAGPAWRTIPGEAFSGGVAAIARAARYYYFAPRLWTPDAGCAYFDDEDTRSRWHITEDTALTWNQSVAWFTALALTGGTVRFGNHPAQLTDEAVAVLTRLLPLPKRAARPIDLFENDPPRVWSLPLNAPAGAWHIVGVFNWDEHAPQTVSFTLASLGLDATAYYTVYDFWPGVYHGLAQTELDIAVPPGSVRLLGLRRYENHPMFLATDRHFSQGASDHRSITWDDAAKSLSGVFDGVADTDYTLRILVPEGYAMQEVFASVGNATGEQEGKVLILAFHCAASAQVEWRVRF